jgi:hypothetical protein
MKKIIIGFTTLAHLAPLTCCPTCIGLPRSPHERPFFERKSFLAAVQEQKPTPTKKSNAAPTVPQQK